MSTAAIVQLGALALLILISGPRTLDASLDVNYRIAHGVVTGVAAAALVWRLATLRRRR